MAGETISGIDPTVPPSGTGCATCLAESGWWLHLRRCAECGRVGCCDTSPGQHATQHARESGHPFLASFEPGEDWIWNVETEEYYQGPQLAPPAAHPAQQPTPGPAGNVPPNWQQLLHD
jgi:Zn-finger in ubiquitin-hydrolases and other protein